MNFLDYLHNDEVFKAISQCTDKSGVKAYVVGGYVRDLLLNRPSKDIDIVCIGKGIETAQKFAEAFGKEKSSVTVYKNFGTARLNINGREVEFTGARKESYRKDSRKPIVEDGTLDDDLKRRDFTINTMAISLSEPDFGMLIDPFDGKGDLKKKLLKTPLDPDITFYDDPLRIMRAVRFATQLDFDIAPDTFEALIKTKDRLDIISQERITEELNKIILADRPSYGFKLLFQSGILEIIFPEMVKLQGKETIDGKSHKDNFYHTLEVLDNTAKVSDDLWLRWAAILHDIAKPQTKRFHPKAGWTFHGHEDRGAGMVPRIFRRMKLPGNEKMRFVQKLVRLHLRPIALVKEIVTDSAVRRLLFDAGQDTEALMMLCRADITSKNEFRVKKYLANFDKVEQKMKEVEERDKIRNFQPAITGEDIMKTFGLKPSQKIGDIKEKLREAVLEGHVRNEYDALYKYMLKIAEEYDLKPVS